MIFFHCCQRPVNVEQGETDQNLPRTVEGVKSVFWYMDVCCNWSETFFIYVGFFVLFAITNE